ncbi:MAG: hypothetical protein ACE5HV_02440 [Acidobacteriota bacterium]
MDLTRANYLSSGERLRVSKSGLARHDLAEEPNEGTYVSQFESPVHGRMVVVRMDHDGAYGFSLKELEVLETETSGRLSE